ncbi:metallophosphoesterase [Bacteroides sp.]|uniref:metallophosphoesterase family protein n=1 Tax=Bacteroides sp. TaxID=29523 RepID=UPI00262FFBC4|nr:metallophosphoesterase [Bacteroides sp.]
MKLQKKLFFALISIIMGSCDLIDYHPYDVRIDGETDINAHNIERIEKNCKDKKTIRFVTMGDSQRWYDETLDFVNDINKRDDIDFVIHGGDLSDFGVTDEFLWQRNILNKLNIPYVALIGNHDCIGTGEETFRIVFGDTNFSFIAGRIKFVCLNTNAIEYDYSRPIPDFEFLANQITERKEEFDKTVVSMHIRPFCYEFNNNIVHVFQRYVTEFPGLQFCTAAHEHNVFEEDLFNDGVMYYMSDCMKNRNYYIFTITPEGYEREVVYF